MAKKKSTELRPVRCIRIHDPDCAEPDNLWRLADRKSAWSFFQYCLANDIEGKIDIVNLTLKEWKAAEKLGREMA